VVLGSCTFPASCLIRRRRQGVLARSPENTRLRLSQRLPALGLNVFGPAGKAHEDVRVLSPYPLYLRYVLILREIPPEAQPSFQRMNEMLSTPMLRPRGALHDVGAGSM
jgi:hypothetical protein